MTRLPPTLTSPSRQCQAAGGLRSAAACLLAVLAAAMLACCSSTAEQQAAKAAKHSYDLLLEGRYADFLEGRASYEDMSQPYREALAQGMEQYVLRQQRLHDGIREVRVSRACADSSLSVMQVFLVLCFGDSTNEEVVVPMVEHRGRWMMK